MKIRSTISSRIIEQRQTDSGFETIAEIGFMADSRVYKQKIFILQHNDDITAGIFKPEIRELHEDDT